MKQRNEKLWSILILGLVNAGIIIVLSFLSPTFLTYENIVSVLKRMSELGMLAIAETIVFISGGFDLSVGTIMALSGLIAVKCILVFHFLYTRFIRRMAALMNALLVVKFFKPLCNSGYHVNIRSIVYCIRGKPSPIPESYLAW